MENRRVRRAIVYSITIGLGLLTILKAPHLLIVGIAGWQIGTWTGDLNQWINRQLDATKSDESQ